MTDSPHFSAPLAALVNSTHSESLTPEEIIAMKNAEWDRDDLSDEEVPFQHEVTSKHLWLTFCATVLLNQGILTKDYDLLDLIDDVPYYAENEEVLLKILNYINSKPAAQWISLFKTHIDQEVGLSKFLMDSFKALFQKAKFIRLEADKAIESFEDEFNFRIMDSENLFNLFDEWYCISFNPDYPMLNWHEGEEIDFDQERYAFIEQSNSQMLHYQLLCSYINEFRDDPGIIYAYSLLLVEPENQVTLSFGKQREEKCQHEYMSSDDVLECVKCHEFILGLPRESTIFVD